MRFVAKVRWLLADKEDGSNDDTGGVMLSGTAHARDLELQRQLLQAAWVDTKRVPTGVLQSALQQTKAFLKNETFELYGSHGVPGGMQTHEEVVAEYARECGEIIDTLPQRDGANRERTAHYLVMSCHERKTPDALRIRDEIAREFAGLDHAVQSELLRVRWDELCDGGLPLPSEPLRSACAATRPDRSGGAMR